MHSFGVLILDYNCASRCRRPDLAFVHLTEQRYVSMFFTPLYGRYAILFFQIHRILKFRTGNFLYRKSIDV